MLFRVNAITPALKAALPCEPFTDAEVRVNEWRGRCLDAFARAETAVTECLVAMSVAGERGRSVGLPHLAGQRYEALAAMIRDGGPFVAEGVGVLGTLERLRAHEHFRNVLVSSAYRVVRFHS